MNTEAAPLSDHFEHGAPHQTGAASLLLLLIVSFSFVFESFARADEAGSTAPTVVVTEELRAELRRYAAWYWDQQDLPQELRDPAFQWHIQPPPGELNPFGEALTLFSRIYSDRLRPLDPVAPYTVLNLLADDPQVMARFRMYTSTGLLDTTVEDGDVRCRHGEALVEALLAPASDPLVGLDDVLVSEGAASIATVSLRLGVMPPLVNPIPDPLPPSLPDLPADIQDADRAMKEAEAIFQRWLQELRQRHFRLYQSNQWWDDGACGFDCDDFAEVLGRFLRWYVQRHAGGQPILEPRILQMRKGWGMSGHTVTLILLGDYYWLIDPQTGLRRGPFHRYLEWPPDASFVADRYWPGSGYEFGKPMHYPADWRPFYEDDPWHCDPNQRERILPELPPDIPPDSILP